MSLFAEPWRETWDGMPEFVSGDEKPADSINVQFETVEDREAFLLELGYRPTRVKSIWYPKRDYLKQSPRDAEPAPVGPSRYPVYVISKGRWESRLTVKALEQLRIRHKVVIEPQEYDNYAAVINPKRLLVLPFSNLGQGSIPARNWVWEHALASGAAWHWILDDNLDGFYRLNRNRKVKITDEHPFRPVEDWADRWENLALAGLNYEFLLDRRSRHPPYYLNTRIYSCILIRNDLPHRWRGRYNEDTDLSLRVLKDGLCTALFNAWLCKKMPTMTMTGGNTEDLYQEDGRKLMAESLQKQHPDVVTVTRKWGRWQHHVDYKRFKRNRLKAKKR